MRPRFCVFCKESPPSYKEWEALSRFTTDRGKIVGRSRSGICSKHQRVLTHEIKRARHLALLPFVVKTG
ncbi:30S ribosomal protein S18 [Candidatus Woesebacteria bacterium]|nr:30S ribosomal protein S18 [Candidatus Woesebacteria bacterium]